MCTLNFLTSFRPPQYQLITSKPKFAIITGELQSGRSFALELGKDSVKYNLRDLNRRQFYNFSFLSTIFF